MKDIYTYSKEWSDHLVDSTRFEQPRGHTNPSGSLPYRDASFHSGQVRLGAFALSDGLVSQLSGTVPISLRGVARIPAGGRIAGANEIYFAGLVGDPHGHDHREECNPPAATPPHHPRPGWTLSCRLGGGIPSRRRLEASGGPQLPGPHQAQQPAPQARGWD